MTLSDAAMQTPPWGLRAAFGGERLVDSGRASVPGMSPVGGSPAGPRPTRKRPRRWPVVLILFALCVGGAIFTTYKATYPSAYNAGVRHAHVQASVSASVAASKSAAAVPPPELNCPQRHSDDAIRAINAGTGFIDKQVVVVDKPMTSLLVIYSEPRVFIRAPVGDIRVCGDNAVLVLETPLPATSRIYMGGGKTAVALVDGVPQPTQVWFGDLHPLFWSCYVRDAPTKVMDRPCSQYYAGPDTVLPGQSPSPTPTKTR